MSAQMPTPLIASPCRTSSEIKTSLVGWPFFNVISLGINAYLLACTTMAVGAGCSELARREEVAKPTASNRNKRVLQRGRPDKLLAFFSIDLRFASTTRDVKPRSVGHAMKALDRNPFNRRSESVGRS